jgi:uncharacterized damage-inducible protein DinB
MPDSRALIHPLRVLLEQGAELAGRLELEAFAHVSPLAPGGSVGAHLRHVGDFVRAFLRDLGEGRIDYDRRERDERLERDALRARAELLRLAQALEALAGLSSERGLEVRSEACVCGPEWQRSTVARELGTLLSHTVHHYALIAVLLRSRGLEPAPGFGVAPSTLAHWKEGAACAPRAG